MRGTSGQDHPQLSCTSFGWTFLSEWRTTSGFRRQATKPEPPTGSEFKCASLKAHIGL